MRYCRNAAVVPTHPLRTSRGHRHEKHNEEGHGASLAQQVDSHGGGDQAVFGFVNLDGQVQGQGGNPHRGCQGEGDGKPADATQNVAPVGG